MKPRWTVLLLLECALFVAAALVHSGVLNARYQHSRARIAEAVIASVLLAGAVLSWALPASRRSIEIAAQSFALAGTVVGLFTVAIGVGPHALPDVIYHLGMLAMLVWGLVGMLRARWCPDPEVRCAPRVMLRTPRKARRRRRIMEIRGGGATPRGGMQRGPNANELLGQDTNPRYS